MPAETAALAVAVVALALAIGAHVRFERLRRRLLVLQAGAGEPSLLDALAAAARDVDGLRGGLGRTREELAALAEQVGRTVSRTSVVRYDAFGGTGGHLSFSAALLDDTGDGLVVTSIAGRNESRTYAKQVTAGRGGTELSPEEQQAVDEALARRPA
jgi:Protein of unknown function (DUF4446)